MKLNKYQKLALRTAPASHKFPSTTINAAFGLCGEAGEFAEHIKKYLYQNKPLEINQALLELGDILWYLAYAAHSLDHTLEDIATINIEKLKIRYPEGFNPKPKGPDHV